MTPKATDHIYDAIFMDILIRDRSSAFSAFIDERDGEAEISVSEPFSAGELPSDGENVLSFMLEKEGETSRGEVGFYVTESDARAMAERILEETSE